MRSCELPYIPAAPAMQPQGTFSFRRRRSHYLLAAEAARPSVFISPAIAVARRSWLRDSGRGMDKTGLFVLMSRVNRPDKVRSNRLPDASAELMAGPPDAI